MPSSVAIARPARFRFWIYASVAFVALSSSLFLVRNVDLRVYWYGVNGFFSGTRPAYGPQSGLGFPMEYRYPPVTYLLLIPLKLLSLRAAGFLWMIAAWINGVSAVLLAIRMLRLQFDWRATAACCAFIVADLVLAVRYGNVQPFVIAWILAALVVSERYPILSGALLALAATFKIWPILFLPWLLPKSRRKSAAFFLLFLLALWILPLPFFRASGYFRLLRDWYIAVARVGTTYSEFYYFPGQSLRGVLLRYLTPVSPPLASFPRINFLSLSPHVAVVAWMSVGAAAYAFFAVHMLRSSAAKLWAWDGLAFVLYSLLEPYAVKSGLISLGPAVLIAGCLFTVARREDMRSASHVKTANSLFLAACFLSFFEAVMQYKPFQRYLLSIGLDFWTNILLLAALFIWIVHTPVAQGRAVDKSNKDPFEQPAHTAPTTVEARDR